MFVSYRGGTADCASVGVVGGITTTISPRPTRTSNRATRFQGITWEGDTSSEDDANYDEGKNNTRRIPASDGCIVGPTSVSRATLGTCSNSVADTLAATTTTITQDTLHTRITVDNAQHN